MTKKDQRERAARELCRRAGDPENITFYGKPMWMAYLPEVDTVLRATSCHEEAQDEPTGKRPLLVMETIKNLTRVFSLRIGRS
jgi:hypothetical protein